MKLKWSLGLLLLLWQYPGFSQEISLLAQFNGRYDYTAFGNTLNPNENGSGAPCEILTSSSADLSIAPDQTVVAAYLYWAGSGSGDFEVQLNGTEISPLRTFAQELDEDRQFFAAVSDVTDQIRASGSGSYTLSDLDLSDIIETYCPTGTNFAGWSVIVVYEDPDLPLNQLNIYEGLERVPESISIELESLNVLDDEGAKIGFLAWEGDAAIAVTETLSINGDIISNPPLNPADNAFNGTNSFTGSAVLYNMDIDFYDIEDNIEPGDSSALIELTSGQDFVMINNIITVLNSQLPDATASLDGVNDPVCGQRELTVGFTIYNLNSTDVLPAGTPIAFFADDILIATAATLEDIPIDGQQSQSITLNIPESVPNEFELRISADNTGDGLGIVSEINEENNDDTTMVRLLKFPDVPQPTDLERCDAVGVESFDLTQLTAGYEGALTVSFHLSEEEATSGDNPIAEPESYIPTANPQTLYLRVANADCFTVLSFVVEVIICPLPDATVLLPTELTACRGRELSLTLRVLNLLGTAVLPAGTPVAVYADGTLIQLVDTPSAIPTGGFVDLELLLLLFEDLPDEFSLLAVADDLGTGTGIIEELDETNNTVKTQVRYERIPELPPLPDQILCDEAFDQATFDLTAVTSEFWSDLDGVVTYYQTAGDAILGINPIIGANSYTNQANPQEIFVRLDTEVCFEVTSLTLEIENCPPVIPQGFSPNADGINDLFEIVGLLDIFPDHRLEIYSRNGNLIYSGNNSTGHWNGVPNRGLGRQEKSVPAGVYYYVLYLNDENYKPRAGWLYLNRE